MNETIDPLEQARRTLGLSVTELWWRYFALGGSGTELEMEAVLFQALVPANIDRDTLAVALNERFSELGSDQPIPYSDDDQ
jgi:hypothetical protein